MSITVSAPGKVFLMGEHSVVYGKPALLAAIDKRLYVTIENAHSLEFISDTKTDHLSFILDLFEKKYKIAVNGVKITVTSNIPSGQHIGSSAALAVATIGALMRYFLKIWDPQKINELSYEAEKKMHGNPSGADNTICCFGGLLWYRKETEFLKSIWSLPIISYQIPRFILIDTGKPLEGTREMVSLVKTWHKNKPSYMERIFTDQEKQTKRALVDLKTGNHEDLKLAIIAGEQNLEKMGVVSNSTRQIIKKIEKIGGAAKICGGGGKSGPTGMLLVYHPNPLELIDLAKKMKLNTFYAKLGEEGVRMENG